MENKQKDLSEIKYRIHRRIFFWSLGKSSKTNIENKPIIEEERI